MARRMSATLKEYQFFRSFSAKIENWPLRKAEAIWRKMRERKIAGEKLVKLKSLIQIFCNIKLQPTTLIKFSQIY